MSEFIGSRISLVSRSDIRYVGTLHEINSETSTVALENVSSYGTEGRKNNVEEEIPPSNSVYEYIVFRGSDVKDLRIEAAPTAKENKQPQVPNDPAILGSGSRPPPVAQAQRRGQQFQPVTTHILHQQNPMSEGAASSSPPNFSSFMPPFYNPRDPQAWGGRGVPGFPGMPPYGAPAGPPPIGWFPSGNQGFPPHGVPFPSYGYPPTGPQVGQYDQQNQQQQLQAKPDPIGVKQQGQSIHVEPAADKQEPKSLAKPAEVAASPVLQAPAPPIVTKPSAAEIKTAVRQPLADAAATKAAAAVTTKAPVPIIPVGPRIGHVQPAIPFTTALAAQAPLHSNHGNTILTQPIATATLRDATQAATAAVAAAMAKLPPTSGQTNGNAMDNLTRKVNEMRTNDPIRGSRQSLTGGFTNHNTRGRGRGASRNGVAFKVEVPATDFDFESSNAKFSKQDLVKEAIAGSPQGTTPNPVLPKDGELPASGYNRSNSFFDNISSEAKERMEPGNTRPGGREWRGEEQKKNVETFGQGSVDHGYRGAYRGRGRGRGVHRGRGNYAGNVTPGRGRGEYRGGRGKPQVAT